MRFTIMAIGLALGLPFAVQAQENVNVETGDTSVHVGDDGVKVKVGDTEINVGETAVQVKTQTGTAGEPATAGVLTIDGAERVLKHACDATHARTIHINGSDNRVTLTGDCDSVVVSGTDNVVTIEGSARIAVTGVDNKITYKRGKAGKPPVIQKTGVDNTVVKLPK